MPESRKSGHHNRFKWDKVKRLTDEKLVDAAAKASRQTSFFQSMSVVLLDSHPTLYVVRGRSKPVIHGKNSTEPKLFHHGETTYTVG